MASLRQTAIIDSIEAWGWPKPQPNLSWKSASQNLEIGCPPQKCHRIQEASGDRNIRRRRHAMVTKDGFDADDSLLLFLSTDKPLQNFGNDRPVTLLRVILKASILVAMAIAISVAPVENPVLLSATASLFDKAASPPSTDQSAPIIQSALIQSTAGAEALPPTVKNAPSQTRTENTGSSPEALFRKFQAWSAEQDARARAKKNAPAPVRSVEKQRRAQNQSVKNAEEPSFLESLFSRLSPPQRGP